MDIPDKDILSQLKLRKVKLTLELQRVELAIRAFEEVDLNSMNQLELIAIDPDVHTDFSDDAVLELKPVMYHSKMTYDERIIWALGKLKSATTTEITDYLIRFDTTIPNRTRLLKSITFSASRLFRTGKIDAVKRSRINIYSLK